MQHASESTRREWLLSDIFAVLDQKRRGFVSRVELSHILAAMQADASVKFSVPDSLAESGRKDSRVTLDDLHAHLAGLSAADLEDVRWFAESVVRVERELRGVWLAAATSWRERVARLYERGLHRYLLSSQPERVSRWLLMRTPEEDDEGVVTLMGLGVSQQEVEVLFADETAEDILRCGEKADPFLAALDLRLRLEEVTGPEQAQVLALLAEHAEQSRELACLLIHEDTLSFAAAACRVAGTVHGASRLIVALLGYRLQESPQNFERLCRQRAVEFLELGLEPAALQLELERRLLHSASAKPRLNVGDWLATLLTLHSDVERGEMLQLLLQFDSALLAHGRAALLVLCRLDVASHHSLHEHSAVLRAQLWKLLLRVLCCAGNHGRKLFRVAEGIRVACSAAIGSSWGSERAEELTEEEEEDMGEGPEPDATWPRVEPPHRFYVADFEDGQDREPALDFLRQMANSWGEEGLVEEMQQHSGTLQTLSRLQPPPCALLQLLLASPQFPGYLRNVAARCAGDHIGKQLQSLSNSLFPFELQSSTGVEVFRSEVEEVEARNATLRLLAFAYHNLRGADGTEECCRLLASKLPLSVEELRDVSVAVHARSALGAVHGPSLLPELRLLQLLQLREGLQLPQFLVDLQDLLEVLTREQEPIGAPCLAGAEFPWRTGQARLVSVRIERPLRRSQLRRFPRLSPLDVVRGLELALGTEGAEAIVLGHLCYFQPQEVALEDTAKGLHLRLGLSLQLLQELRSRLEDGEEPVARVALAGAAGEAIVVLRYMVGDSEVAFVGLKDTWMLWANSVRDSAQVLTECEGVEGYFG